MVTRAPLTEFEKQYISMRKQQRATLPEIADELHCATATTRKWWRMQREQALPQPRGRPAAGILSTYPARVRQQAVALKRAHPHWGPANVQLELQQQLSLRVEQLPSLARLSALFKAECADAVQPRQHQQYPAQPPAAVSRPHQRWQIDGKEKVALAHGAIATLLNIRDPAGALMIGSQAIITTTAKAWRKVTLPEVQQALRLAFSQWGCPLEVQSDHEVVYVGSPESVFPSLFTLWLAGLGLTHIVSRARRPTDQPQVERGHRTLGDMAWKDEPPQTLEQLQGLLDARRHRYNHLLPVQAADCAGRPPLLVYPWALHSGRPFQPELEWAVFDLQRVDAFLARQVWTRQISASGNVGLGNHLYYLGRSHLQQTVSVQFLPARRTFRFQTADGSLISERPAVGLEQADLIGFQPIMSITVPFQLPLPLLGV